MRFASAFLSCAVAVGMSMEAGGADVILKDGQSIATTKPYVVKGKMALLTRTDGSLVSIPADEIDVEKTAQAQTRTAPIAVATPVAPKKPTTPAEAAKATSAKRATVILTDADVRAGAPAGPEGEKSEKGEGELSMGPTSETRTKSGYTIAGTVVNSGAGDVSGASVTIQVIGEENKVLQSTFGKLSKDSLEPGEKATFTAEVATEGEAKKFRYTPSHQIAIPVKPAESGAAVAKAGATASGQATKKAASSPESNPAPGSIVSQDRPEQPRPTPQIIPRPDVAPPAASAPVGSPAAPGGAYLPRPADSQAGPPRNP